MWPFNRRPKPLTIAEMIDPKGPICRCGSRTIYADGIGHYCPNRECPVRDGPFDADALWDHVTRHYPKIIARLAE